MDLLSAALNDGERSLESIPALIRTILKEELWQERRVKTGDVVTHTRFVDFLTAQPLEGLGEKPELIKRMIRDDPETLAAFETAITNPVGTNQHRKGGDIITTQKRGTDKAYTLRRLAKDAPALFEKVKSGELSANQAAIKAGFRKVPSVLDILKREWVKAGKSDRETFLRWVCEQGV